MWMLALLTAFAQEPPPPAEPIQPEDGFNSGRGIALGGLAMGVAGNVIGAIGTVRTLSETDPETGVVSPEGFEIARPYQAVGGIVLHGLGAPVMAAGTLKMRRANQLAGSEHTALWGQLSMGLGIGSAAANIAAFAVDSPTDGDRQVMSSAFGLSAGVAGAAAYTFGIVQYVIAGANRPVKRRPVESASMMRHQPSFSVTPSAGGLTLAGTW